MPMPPLPMPARWRAAIAADPPGAAMVAGLAILAAHALARIGADFASGGNPWKQGDWLVNAEASPIRRGGFGSALLRISDALGIGPVTLVCAVQAAVGAVLFGAILALAWRLRGRRVMWLLFLSPAFAVIFWQQDPQGALRKEVFAFAALALLALRAGGAGRGWAAPLAFALMAVGLAAHEATVLFLPAFGVCLVAAYGRGAWRGGRAAAALCLCALGAWALGHAAANASAPDWRAVCAPLLDRGAAPRICQGAIAWLRHDAAVVVDFLQANVTWRLIAAQGLVMLAALAPLVWLAARTDRGGALAGALIASTAVFAPLYVVALDWGRFLDFQVTAWGLSFCALVLSGRVRITGDVPLRRLAPLLACSLLWSPSHVFGLD